MGAAKAFLLRLRGEGITVTFGGLRPELAKLMDVVAQHVADESAKPAPASNSSPKMLERIGLSAEAAFKQTVALLSFVGESSLALADNIMHPARLRWRPMLYNSRTAGLDALPIVGLLSFLLGVVVAYQGADQLRQYGANVFVADLVGVSLLREFAPLITVIIVAGRRVPPMPRRSAPWPSRRRLTPYARSAPRRWICWCCRKSSRY